MLHPISFCIPEEKIATISPHKTKTLSSSLPGKVGIRAYIFNDEDDYYADYQKSVFAITCKKAGWDCMRHYEIIANWCIPCFTDIEQCPINTMSHLPKQLIIRGNALYENLKDKSPNEYTTDNNDEYSYLINELVSYAKGSLTTSKMAQYVLDASNCIDAKRILYLSGDTSPDYLRCLLLHGFKRILGNECHDYPKIAHMYIDANTSIKHDRQNLYGKGFTYSRLLEDDLHNNSLDESIENDIIHNKYDVVIYGSYHRGMPYYKLVNKHFSPSKIILFCGEDLHSCNYSTFVEKGHHVFVREQ